MVARATGGFSRRRRIALAVALVLLAALVALWLLRKPIATRYVDRTLAAAGVPARYTVADLGLGAQRLTNVVIGDPANPDLVADWVETRTRITAHGPELSGVRAGHLRVRGRLVDGKLSLGAIDRLLPKGDGSPFALPKLDLDVDDGRMRLETPYGVAGVSLRGKGRLDDGFDGRVAVVSERLGKRGCGAERVAAVMAVRTGRRITLNGPLRAARFRCQGGMVAALAADASLSASKALNDWRASARLATGSATLPGARAAGLSGTIAHDGRTQEGTIELTADALSGLRASARRLSMKGPYLVRRRGEVMAFEGRVVASSAQVAVPAIEIGALRGTPLAPLAASTLAAARRAVDRFDFDAVIGLNSANGVLLYVNRLDARSASGASVAITSDGGSNFWRLSGGHWLNGRVRMGGGGLPLVDASLRQEALEPIRGTIRVAPYAAGGARLAITPVRYTANGVDGDTRIVTTVTLSGPLADGAIEGLSVPLDLYWTREGRSGLVLNRSCTPVAFRRLAVSGLTLRPARLRLCPTGPALVRVADNEVTGGARLDAARLTGTLGSTPVTLALGGATLRLADRGFALEGVETRLGQPGRVTRLDFARLEGRAGQGGLTGTFAGGKGQIANVPLLLADAAGDWRFAGGALRLTGALGVSDAQAERPRFQPMQARDVSLGLADGIVTARGRLHEPTTGTAVADVAIRHALGPGTGSADLTVPNLTFAKGFQPELLTRLTFGVVADVAGTVSGEGHIAWDAQGVTSTGTFRTAGTDLSAAVGPVTGIAGEVRFTDLLALESAPGQVVTIRSVNPGIAVTDGTIRYQLLPDTRVRIEGGEWPFAGGRLTLDPTTLDFAETAQRRMTFRVDGVAADRFLQQFDFKNLDATGTFDGVLPMVFDQSGGRIEAGHMAVRPSADGSGGTIAYVGEITGKDVGFWGNLAFQALKSLRYRSLSLTMNGPLAGEMITDVRFAGVSQGEGAKGNFLVRRLQRLPFVFNVRIKAPFRGLLDSAQSFYDPRRLIQRNLPALLEQQNSVQPRASGPMQEKDKR